MLSLLLIAGSLAPPGVTAAPEPRQRVASRRSDVARTPAARTSTRTLPRAGERLRGVHGEDLGPADDPATALRGRMTNPLTSGPPVVTPVPPATLIAPTAVYPLRVSRATLTTTGTGWDESLLYGVPAAPLSPAPLLVVHHGYSSSELSILFQTDYFAEAMARGWYVLAPLGAHDFNYGVPYSQENVKAAIEWMAGQYFIDSDRIYSVGFSMGGGMAASFAARHLDPDGPRIAAVVNHTGTTSLRDVWVAGSGNTVLESPFLFGGTPDQFPFAYQQASTIDLVAGVVDPLTDMARNLHFVPAMSWSVVGDPNAYLVVQTSKFHEHLLQLGGDSTISLGNQLVHQWSTLDETAVLDFFEPIVLQDPPPATTVRVLADRSADYYGLDVTQQTTGEFSSFQWKAAVAINRMLVDFAENLSGFEFLPEEFGLDSSQSLEVLLQSTDSLPLNVRVRGYALAPQSVLRDGVATSAWTFAGNAVEFTETDSGSYHFWRINP